MAEAATVPAARRRTAVAAELGLDAVHAWAAPPPLPAPLRCRWDGLRGVLPLLQPGLGAWGGPGAGP